MSKARSEDRAFFLLFDRSLLSRVFSASIQILHISVATCDASGVYTSTSSSVFATITFSNRASSCEMRCISVMRVARGCGISPNWCRASQFLLDRLTRQCLPMRVRRIFQNFYVVTHALKTHIQQPLFMPLTLPRVEVFMHLPHIVKQIANADRIRLFPKWILICFHGSSSIKSLTPLKWVGRHVTLRLRFNCLPT